MEIFLFTLGVIGMTHILVDATIFQPLRDWMDAKLPEKVSKLIHCYQCTGFWCGLFCGFLAFPFNYGYLFLAGCAGSVLANFVALYMNYLEALTVINLPPTQEENGDKVL
jgi:hypothetical protein